MQSTALEAIQHVAEAFVVQVLDDTRECSEHAGRKTILSRDMRLVMRLRNGCWGLGGGSGGGRGDGGVGGSGATAVGLCGPPLPPDRVGGPPVGGGGGGDGGGWPS